MVKKNTLFRCLQLCFIFLIVLSPILSVHASTTYKTDLESKDWTCPGMSNGGYLKVGNKKVFCVQPHVIFQKNQNYVSSQRPTFISEAQQKRFELYSYYASNVFNGERYWAAAQSLIWLDLGDNESSAIFKVNGTSVINEMNQIKEKANQHHQQPSFHDTTIQLKQDIPYEIIDTNGVLDNFTLSSVEGITVEKKGNRLILTASSKAPNHHTFTLENRANYDQGKTTWYKLQGSSDTIYYDGWQRTAEFFVSDIISSKFSVTVEKKGQLQLEKTSSFHHITSDNENYSLENATYGLFKDSQCKDKIQDIKILSNGNSTVIDLFPGNYYVKELSSPKGYLLNPTIYLVTIFQQQLTQLSLSDVPITTTCDLLLKKIDHSTNTSKPIKNGSLENALYRFSFYVDEQLKKEWIMKTDQQGEIYLKENYKVSGDSFYFIDNSPVLPLGTLKIQEIQSPQGYHIDSSIYTIDLTDASKSTTVYQAPIIKEVGIQLELQKVNQESKEKIENISFIHTFPDGQTETLTTDENGTILMTGLSVGIHTFQELYDNYHYLKNDTLYSIEVLEDGSMISKNENVDFRLDDDQNGTLVIENQQVKGQIEIEKYGEKLISFTDNQFIYEKDGLHQVQYDLYASQDILDIDLKTILYEKGEWIETIQTDENGKGISSILPLGCYEIKETQCLDGYIRDETIYRIDLTSDNPSSTLVLETLELYNQREKIEFSIVKQNSKQEALEGAKFELYTQEDIYNASNQLIVLKDTLLCSVHSDEFGIIDIPLDLPHGKYYLIEVSAPEGYELNETPIELNTKSKEKIIITNDQIIVIPDEKIEITKDEPILNIATGDKAPIFILSIFFLSSCIGVYMMKNHKRN